MTLVGARWFARSKTVPYWFTGSLGVAGEAGAIRRGRWVHLESEHVDAQTAEEVESAVQLRLIEQLTGQHRSRRHIMELDSGEAFAESLVQPALDPDTESSCAEATVLMVVLHVTSVR